MSLLSAQEIEVSFGDRHVLRGASLDLKAGQKIGLVGANGSGKSTLLSVLSGDSKPDQGTIQVNGRRGILQQEPVLTGATVALCVEDALSWHAGLLTDYELALERGDLDRSAQIQDRLDIVGWEVGHQVDAMLDRLGAPPRGASVDTLSGGERRRVALALALLGQPDLLFLDEPTNHLDADAVEWLQSWLQGYRGALLLVTHDRYLLEAVATRIIEMELGRCVAYEGSYADYLLARAERQIAMQSAESSRLRLMAREAEWASRSPAARSTKQKARLQRLEALRDQEGLPIEKGFKLDLRTGTRFGGVLLELRDIAKRYPGGPELLGGFDLSLSPRERIGILGPNGAGKSTLLKILAGSEAPDSGERNRGNRVGVAVLDQHRTGLDHPDGRDWTVFEAAGGGNDWVQIQGRQSATWQRGAGSREAGAIHVTSFLSRFMFTRQMLDQKVSALSGGERARLLMAKLLLHGAQVLLLDEPTNDLDLMTLRVLEEALLSYDGAVVVVTHDRAFLDRVCTAVVAFEPRMPGEPADRPRLTRYSSRVQYLRALEARRKAAKGQDQVREVAAGTKPGSPKKAKKLSYREQREFEALPDQIDALEAEQGAVATRLAHPSIYKDAPNEAAELQARARAIPDEIERLFERWSELEARV